jgi:hypothetical protein
LNGYTQRVISSVMEGHCCLLLGAPGAGKSHVLRDTRLELAGRDGWQMQCVEVDAGQAQLTPAHLLLQLLYGLKPRDEMLSEIDRSEEDALRACLHNWMNRNHTDIVLVLDHVELLNQPVDIFKTIRAVHMKQDYHAQADERAGRFITILASTHSLREVLMGDASPLRNIVTEVLMEDCPPAARREHWGEILSAIRVLPNPTFAQRLDVLCGGDHYQIRCVSAYLLNTFRGRRAREISAAEAERALAALQADAETHVPFLRKMAQRVEDDLDLLEVVLRMLAGEQVPAGGMMATLDHHSSFLSSGILVRDDGHWQFRSELTRDYLERQFARSPERVAHCFGHKQRYAQALDYLVRHREKARDAVDALRDVALSWVQSVKNSADAWQAFATILQTWFGDDARLLRYHPQRHNVQVARYPYYVIQPGQPEVLADTAAAQVAHRAYHQHSAGELSTAPMGKRPFLDLSSRRMFFPILQNGVELCCVITPLLDTQLTFSFATQDQHNQLFDLFETIAGMIVVKEQREKPDQLVKLLADVQRMVQEQRQPEETDRILYLILTAITAAYGLGFNRCAVFQAEGHSHLHGRAAIGHIKQEDVHRTWKHITADTFEKAVVQTPARLEDMPAGARTPLQGAIAHYSVDWTADPLLKATMTDEPVMRTCSLEELSHSPLGALMTIEDGADGRNNPAVLLPLRAGDGSSRRLVGLMVADKPFAGVSVSPDELGLLPKFADQVTWVLLNEEKLREHKAMQQRLDNSLTLDAYEMIEAEYNHQWSKRARAIRNHAHWALQAIDMLPPSPEVQAVREHLQVIEQTSLEALSQVIHGIQVQRIRLSEWLRNVIDQWNLESKLHMGLPCTGAVEIDDTAEVETRPVVLRWVIRELLNNADAAERRAAACAGSLNMNAQYDAAQRLYVISIRNATRVPTHELALMRTEKMINSSSGSGRGVLISRGQVQRLLGGQLLLPVPEDEHTVFTVCIPQRLHNGY